MRPSVTSAAGNTSGSAAAGCCARINGNGEGDEDDEDDDISMEYDEDVLTEALMPGHSRTQEWVLPFPASGQSSSEAASTSGPGRLRPRQILLKFNAPENLKLAVIRCTFSRVEDVGEDFSGARNFAYGCHADPSFVRNPIEGCLQQV